MMKSIHHIHKHRTPALGGLLCLMLVFPASTYAQSEDEDDAQPKKEEQVKKKEYKTRTSWAVCSMLLPRSLSRAPSCRQKVSAVTAR